MLLACYALGASGQDFSVPRGYKFSKAEDYTKHEADIVKCFDWLMATPPSEQTTKREKASQFLTEWLLGSPVVHIEFNKKLVTFTDNPELLMVFMGGWAKYVIESKDDNNKLEGNFKGLEAVVAYYEKNKAHLSKNKNIEKYAKMNAKGKLQDFVVSNF